MGGYGSGPYGLWGKSSKTTVEECRSIDIRQLYREDLLRPGVVGSSKWSRNGREIASIGWQVTKDN